MPANSSTDYQRVIPRDLFNEANLLKCLGQLTLLCESLVEHDGGPFEVYQDPNSGAITCTNVTIRIGVEQYQLWRPLNSRESWPLYVVIDDERYGTVEVFDNFGRLSPMMDEALHG